MDALGAQLLFEKVSDLIELSVMQVLQDDSEHLATVPCSRAWQALVRSDQHSWEEEERWRQHSRAPHRLMANDSMESEKPLGARLPCRG